MLATVAIARMVGHSKCHALHISCYPTTTAGYTVGSGANAPTYQVVGFSNDFRTSNQATTLNTSSKLVKAAAAA